MRAVIGIVGLSLLFVACGGGGGRSGALPQVAAPSGVAIGEPCRVDGDCRSGQCDLTVPDGYCVAPCVEQTDCPPSTWCHTAPGEVSGTCFQACQSQRECRDARFACFEVVAGSRGVCFLDESTVRPSSPNLGSPCTAEVECMAPGALEPLCIREISPEGRQTGFAGGMCAATGCSGDADCGGGRCVPTRGTTAGLCLPACDGDGACRAGYRCGDGDVCVPAGP